MLNTGNLGGDEHVGDQIFKQKNGERNDKLTAPLFIDLLPHDADADHTQVQHHCMPALLTN